MKKYFLGSLLAVAMIVVAVMIFHGHTQPKPVAVVNQKSYVALGDSVAAGVGLKYDSDPSACDRTDQSYPDLLASRFNYKLHSLACSGATISDGLLGSQDVNQLAVPAQLQQLFSSPKPYLVSLTIGANDIRWTDILTKCYVGKCGLDGDSTAVNGRLSQVQTNLQSVLQQIHDHYGTSAPRVVIAGYYQVFPASVPQGCTDLSGIDSAELAWGRQMQSDLSSTIQQAVAGYPFAHYVPISFTGHELCTASPWIQGLADKQPYHPTAEGQSAIADQITSTLRTLK